MYCKICEASLHNSKAIGPTEAIGPEILTLLMLIVNEASLRLQLGIKCDLTPLKFAYFRRFILFNTPEGRDNYDSIHTD